MDQRILSQGAESIIYINDNCIHKDRIAKTYRHPDLDKRIRTSRTRKEVKILKKLNDLEIPSPKYVRQEEFVLIMEYIEGECVKNIVQEAGSNDIFREIGVIVRMMHDNNIIHGDLTTGNFVRKDKVYVIDFGLSYVSTKVEDKAVDLYVFEKSILCAHNSAYIVDFYEGYNFVQFNSEVMKKLEDVKRRGRKREETMIG